MTDDAHETIAALIGRIQHTLEMADAVLATCQPKDKAKCQRLRELIAQRLNEINELYPAEDMG